MTQTQEFMVSCGTAKVATRLPVERTRIPAGPPPSSAPLADAAAKFRQALAEPVGMPPLQKLVKRGAKVTIGIQDGRAVNYHPEDQDLRILEATYGILPWAEIGQYFATARLDNGDYEYAGSRTKLHFGVPQTADWPVALGGNIELDYMRRAAEENPLTLELRPIAETRIGKLLLIGNFAFEKPFSGPGTCVWRIADFRHKSAIRHTQVRCGQ